MVSRGVVLGNHFQERLFGVAGSCISGGLVISVNSFGARGALFIHMVATFTAEAPFWVSKAVNAGPGQQLVRPYGCTSC